MVIPEKRSVKKLLTAVLAAAVCFVLLLTFGEEAAEWLSDGKSGAFHYTDGTIAVHFIDVGQGASTLIQSGSKGILIDAGEWNYADKVIDYIHACGVQTLSCVIATHPHSDHIGALPDVLDTFPVETIVMPRLSKENTPTSSTYERLLTAVKRSSVKVNAAKNGKIYALENAKLEILGPLVQDENLNNMSVVCRLTAFSTTFLLLADAEKAELKTIDEQGTALQSDVLSVAHHGSRTSLYQPFLNRVGADVAVISCGKDNDYGHPHKEVLQYLKRCDAVCYRTDECGSIVFVCDEAGYEIQTAA